MSEPTPPAGGRKILGMPRAVVIVGVIAVLGGVAWFWWRNRSATSANAQATGATTSASGGIDWSGPISTLQTEVIDMQGELATIQKEEKQQAAGVAQLGREEAEQERDESQEDREGATDRSKARRGRKPAKPRTSRCPPGHHAEGNRCVPDQKHRTQHHHKAAA